MKPRFPIKFEGVEDATLPDRDEVREFELTHGLSLPEDYRDFLLTQNGGSPVPSLCLWDGNGDFVAQVFGLNQKQHWFRLENAMNGFREAVATFLPVAESNGGNYFLLKLAGSDKGSVFFWDHELEDVSPATFNQLIRVAPSFTEFIQGLVPEPADDESIHPLDI